MLEMPSLYSPCARVSRWVTAATWSLFAPTVAWAVERADRPASTLPMSAETADTSPAARSVFRLCRAVKEGPKAVEPGVLIWRA